MKIGRLWKSVKGFRMDAAGHQIVARAFGRAGGQHRGFDLKEASLVEKTAHALKDAVAHRQMVTHRRTAQVQIAVLQARVFGDGVGDGRRAGNHRFFGDGEGQRIRLREHGQFIDHQFDCTGLDVGILGTGLTLHQCAAHRDTELGAQRGSERADLGRRDLRAEYHLEDAAAIAQMDKEQSAVVAESIDPASQQERLSNVRLAYLPAENPFVKHHTLSAFHTAPGIQ